MTLRTLPSWPRRFAAAFSLLLVAGCSVEQAPAPAMTGPSELALRISMQTVPDSILQDGASQASLQIEASGPDGAPARGLALRVETWFNGIVQDFGVLSAKTVITGEDGRARVVYTSPARPSEPVETDNVVEFRVYPIGSNFSGEVTRSATLRLVTPGVLRPPTPPNASPTARFVFAPAQPTIGATVTFDASTSTDLAPGATGEAPQCGARCTYAWDFGDGGRGTGVFASHQFQRAGNYQVRLTVTDAEGASHTAAQAASVEAGAAPTAVFSISPTAPAAGQAIFFNASASRSTVTGRTIVSYDWDFGSGRTGSGVTVSKTYDTPGTYNVTLTVTDSVGVTGTASQSVTVAAGELPTPTFTVSPAAPAVSQQIFFNAESSRAAAGRSIASYEWNFGDGSTGRGVNVSKAYEVAATYTVTLRITDNTGRSATSSQTVTVGGTTTGPQADLTISPTSGTTATTFFFDASASRGPSSIVDYTFDFGDGTIVTVTNPRTQHRYVAAGSYVVRLTVRDNAGRSGTTTRTLSVQ